MTDAREDLAMIRALMQESQRVVSGEGAHLVVWGAIAAVGLVATYAAVVGVVAFDPRWLWAVLLVVGWAASFWLGARSAGRRRVTPPARRLLSMVWSGMGATLTLIALASFLGGVVDVRALPGLMAVVLGIGIWSTAALSGLRWMGGVAVGWWVGGALMLFVPGLYTLLLLAGMAVALELVPGLVLLRGPRPAGQPTA